MPSVISNGLCCRLCREGMFQLWRGCTPRHRAPARGGTDWQTACHPQQHTFVTSRCRGAEPHLVGTPVPLIHTWWSSQPQTHAPQVVPQLLCFFSFSCALPLCMLKHVESSRESIFSKYSLGIDMQILMLGKFDAFYHIIKLLMLMQNI